MIKLKFYNELFVLCQHGFFLSFKWHSTSADSAEAVFLSDCMSLIHQYMFIFVINTHVRFLDQFSSCSRRHADCLAFPGGSVGALTCSVWLCSAVLRALDSARSAPQRPASLFSSLSLFSFSQFLHRLPVSAPLCLPIYQRELLSWLLVSGRGERGVS